MKEVIATCLDTTLSFFVKETDCFDYLHKRAVNISDVTHLSFLLMP